MDGTRCDRTRTRFPIARTASPAAVARNGAHGTGRRLSDRDPSDERSRPERCVSNVSRRLLDARRRVSRKTETESFPSYRSARARVPELHLGRLARRTDDGDVILVRATLERPCGTLRTRVPLEARQKRFFVRPDVFHPFHFVGEPSPLRWVNFWVAVHFGRAITCTGRFGRVSRYRV